MYGNNINSPFMIPNMSYGPTLYGNSMMRNIPQMNNMVGLNSPMINTTRGGLSSLLSLGRNTSNTGGLFSGLKNLNFGNILNNTSKALGVVKEAIPIVKEVGPMFTNMKQMLKIASIFKDATDTTTISKEPATNEITNIKENDTNINSTTNTNSLNSEPNFFL